MVSQLVQIFLDRGEGVEREKTDNYRKVLKSLNDDDFIGIETQVDLLKPLKANWVINTFYLMSRRPELIKSGFRQVGLLSDY